MRKLSGLAFGMAALLSAATLGAQEATDRPTVYRDGYGIPHIFGRTDRSIAFGAAWVQAEEDWPAVERNFLRATGRAAEFFGESSLSDDYIARALEIPRLSREEYDRSTPRMRGLLDAYAEGFNAYLAAHPEAVNFLDRVEPWHTLALIKFKYHQLEFLAYAGFEQEYLQSLIANGWPGGGDASAAITPASTTEDFHSGSIMRSALVEAVCGLTESSFSSSSLRPMTPPAALISSTARSAAITPYSPSGPRNPVRGVR